MAILIRGARLPRSLVGTVADTESVDLLVDTEYLAAVRPATNKARLREAEEIVDADGLFVVPGLLDTHVHLLGAHDLELFADAGVTTVAELGTHPDSLVRNLKRLPGMTQVVSAGSAASAPGGTQTAVMGFPAESAVDGPEDAERYLDWRVAQGSDVIKVIIEDPHTPVPGLSPETLRALADGARHRGLLTIAHAATADSYRLGLDAGVDVLTHAPVDRPLEDELVQRMAEAGVVCSPTLVMMRGMVAARAGAPGPQLSFDHAVESVRRMHSAGVRIIAGTDANAAPGSPSPVPHGSSLHEELGLLVDAGLSPAEALAAATSQAAAVLRLADRGQLAATRRADLLLLDADPSEDVTNTRGVRQVWIGGVRVR